jgi:hypothetical protein
MAAKSATLAVLIALGGCAAANVGTELEPAPEALLVPMLDDAAMASVEDVQVVAQPEWDGDGAVLDWVLPISVSITNNGTVPLRIEYRHIELMDADGARFAALPPYLVGGSPRAPQIVGRAHPLEVGFAHRRFALAPYLAPVYPRVPVSSRPFLVDQRYYAEGFSSWRAVDIKLKSTLPTTEMRIVALPEGVLAQRGWVGGYVYFPKLPAGTGRVKLRMNLVDAMTGRLFAIAGIPFVVES